LGEAVFATLCIATLTGILLAILVGGAAYTARSCYLLQVDLFRHLHGDVRLPRARLLVAVLTALWLLISVALIVTLIFYGGPPASFNIWSPGKGEYARGLITALLLLWVPFMFAVGLSPFIIDRSSGSMDRESRRAISALMLLLLASAIGIIVCLSRYIFILRL
jgi:TRAP-type mannitol/chloroaromatic compound transport system permease small subunit